MTFRPVVWFPIAAVLSIVNVAAVGFAAAAAEPVHASAHAVLALAFGLWSQHLRKGLQAGGAQPRLEAGDALDALDAELGMLRQELGETQERLDFAERMLAQGAERRKNPER